MAENSGQVHEVLARALLDLGFESAAVVRRDRDGGVEMLWRSMGGHDVTLEDPLTAANQDVLSRLDGSVHRWAMQQSGVMSHEDFLQLDNDTYTEFMNLPAAFGFPAWATILAIPHRVDGHCFSLGVASTEAFRLQRSCIVAAQLLARIYFAVGAGGWLARGGHEETPIRLSPKQLACLRWAAAGKSYQDIGDILGLSAHTVRYHLESARTQYGHATIVQTVVQAAKDHDFDPMDGR